MAPFHWRSAAKVFLFAYTPFFLLLSLEYFPLGRDLPLIAHLILLRRFDFIFLFSLLMAQPFSLRS